MSGNDCPYPRAPAGLGKMIAVSGAGLAGQPPRFSGTHQRREGLIDGLGGWRTARDREIHREYVAHRAHGGIVGGVDPAPARTVPQGDDALGIGYGIMRQEQGVDHGARDRACDEQDVGMPGACYQTHPDGGKIIDGVAEGLDFELAAVA